jgi:hypothetical protein
VVYVNGVEAWRFNMAATGPITNTSTATSLITGPAETTAQGPQQVPATMFVEGDNLVAVELHQVAGDSDSDASMSLALQVRQERKVGVLPAPAPLPPAWHSLGPPCTRHHATHHRSNALLCACFGGGTRGGGHWLWDLPGNSPAPTPAPTPTPTPTRAPPPGGTSAQQHCGEADALRQRDPGPRGLHVEVSGVRGGGTRALCTSQG